MDAGFMTSGPFASFKWNLPNFFKYKDSSKSFTSQDFIYWNSEFHLRFTLQGDGIISIKNITQNFKNKFLI